MMDYRPGWYEEALKRDLPACNGPCDQGRKPCPSPIACRVLAEDDDDGMGLFHGLLSPITVARDFVTIYKLYRWGGRRYALRCAWRIAIMGVPF